MVAGEEEGTENENLGNKFSAIFRQLLFCYPEKEKI